MLSSQQQIHLIHSRSLASLFTKQVVLFVCLIFISCLFPGYSSANSTPSNQARIDLTAEEKTWLARHPTFKIVAFPLAPYIMKKEGKVSGYMTELVRAVSSKVNLSPQFSYHEISNEAFTAVQTGKVEASMGIIKTPARAKYLTFSPETMPLNLAFFARKSSKSMSSQDELKGKRIASYHGYALLPLTKKEFPGAQLIIANDAVGMLQLVATGKADIAIQELHTGQYMLRNNYINNLEVKGYATFEGLDVAQGHSYVVNKDYPLLKSILDKGYQKLTEKEKQQLWDKWFGKTKLVTAIEIQLTADERTWLAENPVIRLGNSVDWPPFGFINKDGVYSGIAADYVAIIEKILGITIEPAKLGSWEESVDAARKGEVDLLDAVVPTPQRREFLSFTKPYISYPVALFTQKHVDYIADMSELNGQFVTVIASSALHDILINNHPEFEIIPTKNASAGLLAVEKGEASAFIGNLPTASRIISREGITNLKVAGEAPYRYDLTIGINKNKPILANLLQKVLDAIPEEKHNEIYRKWMSVTFEHQVDYSLFIKLFALSIFIFIFIFIWNHQRQIKNLMLEVNSRKLTEESLSKTEQYNRMLFEKSPVGLALCETNGELVDINPAFAAILGRTVEETKSLSYWSITPEKYAAEEQEQLNILEETGRYGPYEKEYIHADGHLVPVRLSGQFLEKGGTKFIWSSVEDITERKNAENILKKSEQSLNEAQLIAHLGSWEWDITNNSITWSDELCRIYGLVQGEIEPSLEYFLSLLSEDTKMMVTDAVDNALTRKADYDIEFPITLENGEERILTAQGLVIADQDGKPLRMIGFTQDITERKLAEHEKEHLQRELQQSQKMEALGKLTGGIAHEYNNMLAIILGFSELLKNPKIKQTKLLKYANEIQHAGNRAAKLTSKLLTFSQHKTPEAESLNLNDLLQKLQHMLEKTLTVRINLIFNLQENLWQVWLDDGDMEDAILNMSINAMHAIEGNGKFTIQTSNQNVNQMDAQSLGIEPGDYVLLSFTDTGYGMDNETKEKIFDPFFTTKGEKGTGLGLSMVYGFVENSGGVIKVKSELEQGTKFTFYFPKYYGSHGVQHLTTDNPVETFKDNKTILVVDDESALLELTNEILSSHGFKVYCTESTKEALNILQHETIDILISDVIMPDMDGYQLAAFVKEKYPEIKIQLASGFADDRNIDMVDEYLQDNLLHKPFSSQELLLRIRELCNGNNRSSISS